MAAGDLIINGNTMTHIQTAFATLNPTTGNYWLSQNALDPRFDAPAPYAGPVDYDERPIKFPGVAGTGIRRFEFAGRPIFCTLAFIGPRATAESALNSKIVSWSQLARYSITLPGTTPLAGCKLPAGGCAVLRNHAFMSGSVAIIASFVFQQLSTEN